ncbi:hypothetical protein GJ744_012434 [Endocarpon pusillum]|uniref:Uncharacterized protein n=1 Tax=Endocarpon pusillum TaxID=364733 RepID=A0A8H7E0B4_9EURO|nr:hypothetical protein GJ744_012434 [Endocarpon pusillum]
MTGVSPLLLSAILKPEVYICCLIDPNDRIEHLRGVAASAAEKTGRTKDEDWIIQYHHLTPSFTSGFTASYAFATALVRTGGGYAQRWTSRLSSKATITGTATQEPVHVLGPWKVEHGARELPGHLRSSKSRHEDSSIESLVFFRREGKAGKLDNPLKEDGDLIGGEGDTDEEDTFLKFYSPKSAAYGTVNQIRFDFYIGYPVSRHSTSEEVRFASADLRKPPQKLTNPKCTKCWKPSPKGVSMHPQS